MVQIIPSRSCRSSRVACADHPGQIVQIILGRSCRSSRADRADHPGQIVQIMPGRSCRSSQAEHADYLSLNCSIFFVPDAWVVSGTCQPIKNYSSGSPNESADNSFAPVCAVCTLKPPGSTWPTPLGPWCWGCGWHIPTNKKFFI